MGNFQKKKKKLLFFVAFVMMIVNFFCQLREEGVVRK